MSEHEPRKVEPGRDLEHGASAGDDIAPRTGPPCCSPAAQLDCCKPADKAACCGAAKTGSSCGCRP